MNKKTMVTLSFRFPDVNNRKQLILDYLRHCKMNMREQHQGISIYDPVMACRLNCIAIIPKILFDLVKISPKEREKFFNETMIDIAIDDNAIDLKQFGWFFMSYFFTYLNDRVTIS